MATAGKKDQSKVEKVELMKLDPNNLAEFNEWEFKLNDLVKKNPFVKITDTKTYNEAKKRRTALKSGRTEVQGQDKSIASFITSFRKTIKEKGDKLILIVKPHEEKQQTEVERWETVLEEKRLEDARLEEVRVSGIKTKITETESELKTFIEETKFENIAIQTFKFNEFVQKSKEHDFKEFNFLFEEMVDRVSLEFTANNERVKQEHEQALVQIEADRRAKINQMVIDAQNEIDALKSYEDEKEICEKINNVIFDDSTDFGELAEEFLTQRATMSLKARKRAENLKSEFILSQKQTTFELRELLTDLVFSMDADNYTSVTNQVKASLEVSVVEEIKEDFEKMKVSVEKQLAQKLELISGQIKLKEEQEAQRQPEEEETMSAVPSETDQKEPISEVPNVEPNIIGSGSGSHPLAEYRRVPAFNRVKEVDINPVTMVATKKYILVEEDMKSTKTVLNILIDKHSQALIEELEEMQKECSSLIVSQIKSNFEAFIEEQKQIIENF